MQKKKKLTYKRCQIGLPRAVLGDEDPPDAADQYQPPDYHHSSSSTVVDWILKQNVAYFAYSGISP